MLGLGDLPVVKWPKLTKRTEEIYSVIMFEMLVKAYVTIEG